MKKKLKPIIPLLCKGLLRTFAFLLPFLAVLIVMGIDWLFQTWSDLSMDEIVYQIKTPMKGTNPDMIYDFLDYAIPPAIMASFLTLLLLFMTYRHKIMKWVLPVCLILVSVYQGTDSLSYAWEKLDVEQYIEDTTTSSHFIEEHYANPNSVSITFPEQKRNLIYIYLESMEATYASTTDGGAFEENCIPELTALANENVSFSNKDTLGGLYSATGSTWTMGALVTQTSGLPLCLNFRHGYISEQVEILPKVTNLGDVLASQGYQQEFIMGSLGTFAGRNQYFIQHGDYAIKDLEYAQNVGWLPEDYMVWWGFEDYHLFEFAKEEATQLADSGQPFNLTLLTVDTHFEDGYKCPYCSDTYDNQYANVMACSSRQVAEFIEWVKQQPFYDNTTIVLVGDHLTMDKDFCSEIDEDYDRTVYNCFINSAVSPVNTKNRVATTLDMFPTTLASLGAVIDGDQLGLGTNLFSSVPTLSETESFETLDAEFRKRSLFYETLAGSEEVNTEVFDME